MQNIEDQFTVDFIKEINPVKAIGIILLVSSLALVFLFWLIYYKGGSDYSSELVAGLPALNALLNTTSAVLLLLGYKAVRNGQYLRHMRFNLTAFFTSALFLVSYVIYHNFHGDTPFTGEGFVRPIYFFILISHIILSVVVVPMILTSFYLAFAGKLRTHRKISKVTLPVWLYVSVTGVLVFLMLRVYG